MNIELARIEDIENINILFREVVKNMHDKGIFMWNDKYPFLTFETDILDNNLYLIKEKDEVVGSFVLSDIGNPDFNEINWNYKGKKWISLNRLAILPEKQGMGYAKRAMEYIENKVKKDGYESIRLTVYDKNEIAIMLYRKFSYIKVEEGSYYFNNMKFIGYEKNIK